MTQEVFDKQDGVGSTALMLASEKGHTEIVRALLDSQWMTKEGFAMQDEMYRRTALMSASRHGHTEIVRALLDSQWMTQEVFDMQDETGWTALGIALHYEAGGENIL